PYRPIAPARGMRSDPARTGPIRPSGEGSDPVARRAGWFPPDPPAMSEVRMSRRTSWVFGLLGALVLGVLTVTGLRFVAGRAGPGLRPSGAAPRVMTAASTDSAGT